MAIPEHRSTAMIASIAIDYHTKMTAGAITLGSSRDELMTSLASFLACPTQEGGTVLQSAESATT